MRDWHEQFSPDTTQAGTSMEGETEWVLVPVKTTAPKPPANPSRDAPQNLGSVIMQDMLARRDALLAEAATLLSEVRGWMIPGMNWTDATGELIKRKVDELRTRLRTQAEGDGK